MKHLNVIMKVLITSILIMTLVSCGTPQATQQATDGAVPGAVTTSNVNATKAKALINDFFTNLYSKSIDDYAASVKDGRVSDNLEKFMAKTVLDEIDGNPEAPFHYPRYIDINGLTMIQYKLLLNKGADGKDVPQIDCGFVGTKGNASIYYVKCYLAATCIADSEFDKAYTADENTMVYAKSSNASTSSPDEINILATYDIGLVNESNSIKVTSFTESSAKPILKDRLSRLNNDWVTRMPYLSSKSDTANEIAFIQKFFRKLVGIDSTRMDEMQGLWKNSQSDYSSYLGKLNLPGVGKGDEGKLTDMMLIDGKYADHFDIGSFPLVINLQRITQIKTFDISPHPAYSKNVKEYIVKFTADAEEKNVISGTITPYTYDYFVTLSGSGDSLKIADMRMNEYYSTDIN